MRPPLHPAQLIGFVLLLAALIAIVQIGLIRIAFDKLGVSGEGAFLLLLATLFGSAVNLPLFSIRVPPAPETAPPAALPWLPKLPFNGRTVVAVNVGGGLIPVAFSIYLVRMNALPLVQVALGVALLSAISYLASRPIRGLGIGMPVLLAPLCAALAGLLINPQQSAPLAYVSGTLGVLIGADLLRLRDLRLLATPVASIGGAGTFDGIFITGIVAVLLA